MQKLSVADRTMASTKDVHFLIPRTCEFVLMCQNGLYRCELKLLRWEVILDYLGGPNVIRRVLRSGRQESQSRRKDVITVEVGKTR